MSTRTVSAALSERLSLLQLPTQYENAAFTPTSGVLYLSEFLFPTETEGLGISLESSEDLSGFYQVNVAAPKDGGKSKGFKAVDDVLRLFRRGTVLTKDGITITITQSSQNPSLSNGDRFVVPITVDYRAFVSRPAEIAP